jgi:hypothetical protein
MLNMVRAWWQGLQDELKERVMLAERAVVYVVDFDLNMLHPYKIALDLAGEKLGFHLMEHTPKRCDNKYDLPQLIFNITNIRSA